MKKSIKKAVSVITAAATLAVSVASMTANAVIINRPNEFILNHAVGAPSSEIQTSQTNYAIMGEYDPAITIRLVGYSPSSNTQSCRFYVPLKQDTEPYWTYFSYGGQRKDIALKNHTDRVEFTCELVLCKT